MKEILQWIVWSGTLLVAVGGFCRSNPPPDQQDQKPVTAIELPAQP